MVLNVGRTVYCSMWSWRDISSGRGTVIVVRRSGTVIVVRRRRLFVVSYVNDADVVRRFISQMSWVRSSVLGKTLGGGIMVVWRREGS